MRGANSVFIQGQAIDVEKDGLNGNVKFTLVNHRYASPEESSLNLTQVIVVCFARKSDLGRSSQEHLERLMNFAPVAVLGSLRTVTSNELELTSMYVLVECIEVIEHKDDWEDGDYDPAFEEGVHEEES